MKDARIKQTRRETQEGVQDKQAVPYFQETKPSTLHNIPGSIYNCDEMETSEDIGVISDKRDSESSWKSS